MVVFMGQSHLATNFQSYHATMPEFSQIYKYFEGIFNFKHWPMFLGTISPLFLKKYKMKYKTNEQEFNIF